MAEHDRAEAEALFSFAELERSYRECRRRKRGTANALRFEENLEENLLDLAEELRSGRYTPRRSVCFVTMRPKCREIIAADFRDRIVHHLLVRKLEALWEPVFIHDSFASRKGKGTHAAVERLVSFIPRVTANHTVRAWYAHLDVRSFFASIDHRVLLDLLARRCPSPTLNWLCERIVTRDIRADAVRKGPAELFDKVPPGKSVLMAPPGKGLPIGNHTSQFFANVYLNELDRFVKHALKVRYYIRYVDDLILLSRSREDLLAWRDAIDDFLRERLLLELNTRATRIAPLSSGVDFLGVVVHPRHRLVRRRVVRSLLSRLRALERVLTGDAGGYSWVFYRRGTSEYLQAMTASYRAHFSHANTARLRARIRQRFPWLRRALAPHAGSPFWELRRAFPCLAAQVHWFDRKFPGCLLAFQVGTFWELYGGSATAVARGMKLRLLHGRRRALQPWTRVPLARLGLIFEGARKAGVRDIVLIGEDGQSSGWVLDRRAVAVGRSA